MTRRKSYRRKPTKRKRTKATVKRRRKQIENRILDIVAKIIRLAILIGICAFIIYKLLSTTREEDQQTDQTSAEKLIADDITAEEPIEQENVELDTLPKDLALDYVIRKVFDNFNLEDSWIKRNDKILRVKLPDELPAVTIIWEIIQEIQKINLKILKSEEDLKANKASISIGTGENSFLTIIFSKEQDLERKAGKIAIIIDDFGYHDNKTTDEFLKFNYPLTVSIIPGQKHSTKIAREAKNHKKTIMIHLPMEPLEEEVEDTEYTIMTNMSDSVIADRIQKAFAFLPDAVGINNHMGSKATADTHVMAIVVNELKLKGKFFVDSKTTNKSVIAEVAMKYRLNFAMNDGFLERKNNEDESYIQRKLAAVAKIAKRRGKAVVIGHPYKETIKVLAEEIPNLEKQGFKIVPITEVIR